MKKKIITTLFAFSLMVGVSSNALAGDTYSGKAIAHSGESASHASQGVTHAMVGSGQVVLATAALPLTVVGAVGSVSASAGEACFDAAASKPMDGTPLEISDETVSVGPPPNEMLKTDRRGHEEK